MKNHVDCQLSLWPYVFIGLLSLLVMQCSCSPLSSPEQEPPSNQQEPQGSEGPQDPPESQKPQEAQEPPESQRPQDPPEVPPLNPITDEMIQAAEKKGKHFLAEQLRKLQKEALSERNMPYINDKTDGDTTALYEAADALFQRPDIVQVLLERGANPNMEDAASDTVLGAAVSSTSISDKGLKTIELLLDAGADLFGGKKGFGPLYSAIDNADKDIRAFELILSKMPNIIHTKDVNGNTALHYAVSLEKEKVIKFLLIDKKSKPNIVNKQNKTPKDLAKVKNKNIRALFGLP